MGFENLLDMLKGAKQVQEQLVQLPPVACPNDGTPLETNSAGTLHCKFDGWTWPN